MKVLVVGGGIIGLSISYEMARRGHDVTLLERDRIAKQASYAGAGIIMPCNSETAMHPIERLQALSYDLHAQWASRLHQETQVDNGYRVCGGIHVARSLGDIAGLAGAVEDFRANKIEFSELDFEEACQQVPSLRKLPEKNRPKKFVWLPNEAQFVNPDHNRALTLACEKRGVLLIENVGETKLETLASKPRHVFVRANETTYNADAICMATGAWTEQALNRLGIRVPTVPVRGQIGLFKLPKPTFSCVIYEGSWYLVPRRDGHVLAGATIEEAGFDPATTEVAQQELQTFASGLIGELTPDRLVKSWAGLRPASFDGMPFLGAVADFPNLYVAAGHFKLGLHLSTGTAVVMSDLIEGTPPSIDLSPFSPNRVRS